MAEGRKTVEVDNGSGQTFWTTPDGFVEYVSSLPNTAPDPIVLSGPINSVYQNQAGELVRESLTGAQIIARVRLGEQPVITSGSDPKLQEYQRQEQAKTKYKIADETNSLALFNSMNPLGLFNIPQRIGRDVMGAEEYEQAVSEVRGANPGLTLAGTVYKGLLLGKQIAGVGGALRGGRPLGGIGQLAADEVGVETAHYLTYINNHNKPFIAEDWGRNVLTGAIFAAPFAGGAMIRSAAFRMRGLSKGAGALRVGADAFTVGSVVSKPGSAKAGARARGAATLRVMSRIKNALFPQARKRQILTNTVDDLNKSLSRERQVIGGFTPEKMWGKTRAQLDEFFETHGGLFENAKLLEDLKKIDYHALKGGMQSIRRGVQVAQDQVKAIHQKISGIKMKRSDVPKLTPEGKALWVQQSDEILYKIDQAGYDDIGGYLGRVVRRSKQPVDTYGALVQARYGARMKGRTVGGSNEVDELLKNFLEDADVWGGPVAARGKAVNKAIDDLASAYDELDHLNFEDKLEDMPYEKGTIRLNALNREIDKIRSGYAELERLGVLSKKQVVGVEGKLATANESVTKGMRAYKNVNKMNNARTEAAKAHSARVAEAPKTAQEIANETNSRNFTMVDKFMELEQTAFDYVQGNKVIKTAFEAHRGGVMALIALRNEDRDILYEHISELLPQLVGAPEALEEMLGDYLGSMEGDPDLSAGAGVAAARTVFWLNQELPKKDRSLYGRELPLGHAKRDLYLEKFMAALDPMSVPYAAFDGRVTGGMVSALKATNPVFYTEVGVILSEVMNYADPVKAPRQVINGFNQLLGGVDPLYTGPALLELQSNYAQSQGQQQVIQGGQSIPDGSNPQKPGNQFTFTQRLTSY